MASKVHSKSVPHEARFDIEIEVFKEAGFVAFDGNCPHDRVVCAQLEWGNVEVEVICFASRLQLLSQYTIGCHAPTTKRPSTAKWVIKREHRCV